MGRKSIKEQRVCEILDAFERCLEKKGMAGTTLENIADEAGMARRMIRHYLGNREEVITAAVVRIVDRFSKTIFAQLDHGDPKKRAKTGLNYLFSKEFNQLPDSRLVAALLPVSLYDEQVRHAVKVIYDSYLFGILKEVEREYPNASKSRRDETAYSILCLAFGGGWMTNIGFKPSYLQKNKKIALQLIEELES